MTQPPLLRVTHIRHELRCCLSSRRFERVPELLAELGAAAGDDRSLRREHERWSLQFDLLAVAGLAA